MNGSKSSDPDGDELTYTWTDLSGTVIGEGDVVSGVSLGIGSHDITLTVSDGTETASDTMLVTVNDTTAPDLLHIPTNITVECDSVPAKPADVTAADNCDGLVTIRFEEERTDGSSPNDYTLKRTWTATDNALPPNSATATQTVTVVDTTAQTITAPKDRTVNAD